MMISDKCVIRNFPMIRTSFCINGEQFNPDYLTEQLHLSPAVAWSRGELRKDHGGNRYYEKHPDMYPGKYTYSHWRYSTEYEQVYDIMQSATLILDAFEPLIDTLLRIKSQFSLSYQISIAIKRKKTKEQIVFPGMILSRNLIQFAAVLGAEISWDFEGIFFD